MSAVPSSLVWVERLDVRMLLGLVLLVGLVRVVLVLLSGAGLHVDEAQYGDWSRDLAWGYYSKPPVIALLIRASTALFGDSVLGVRLLAMVCWLVSAWLLHGLAQQLVRDCGADGVDGPAAAGQARHAGRWAVLLMLATPLSGVLGLSATTDAPLLLCWTLALRLAWLALRQGAAWHWLALGAVIGAGCLSKYTMAAFMPGALLLLVAAWRERAQPAPAARGLSGLPRPLGVLIALLPCALLLAPHLAWNARMDWPTWRHTAEITAGAQLADGMSPWHNALEFAAGQWLMLGPLTGGCLLWCGAMWLKRLPHRTAQGGQSDPVADAAWVRLQPARRHLLWLSLPLLGIGLAQALHAQAQINWTAPALPGLVTWLALRLATSPVAAGSASVAAAGVASAWGQLRRIAAWGIVLQWALVLLVTGVPGIAQQLGHPVPLRADIWARMRGWDDAFAQLRPLVAARPDQPLLAADRELIAQARPAWRDLPNDWRAWRGRAQADDHYQLTRPLGPQQLGRELLIVTDSDTPLPVALQARLDGLRLLGQAPRPTAADPAAVIRLWQARLVTWPTAEAAAESLSGDAR